MIWSQWADSVSHPAVQAKVYTALCWLLQDCVTKTCGRLLLDMDKAEKAECFHTIRCCCLLISCQNQGKLCWVRNICFSKSWLGQIEIGCWCESVFICQCLSITRCNAVQVRARTAKYSTPTIKDQFFFFSETFFQKTSALRILNAYSVFKRIYKL